MPECSKCGIHIRTGTLCEIHAVEQRAAGVDHDRDVEPTCAGCEEYAPNGDYSDERRGMWFCPACSALELRPEERRQVAAETPDALAGAVQWAVGDGSAFPEQDPGIETGFQTASQRLIADGGDANVVTISREHAETLVDAAGTLRDDIASGRQWGRDDDTARQNAGDLYEAYQALQDSLEGDDGEGLEPPFWCPWCEAEVTSQTSYGHAFEHQDKGPYAEVVEKLLIDAQEDAPEEVGA